MPNIDDFLTGSEMYVHRLTVKQYTEEMVHDLAAHLAGRNPEELCGVYDCNGLLCDVTVDHGTALAALWNFEGKEVTLH